LGKGVRIFRQPFVTVRRHLSRKHLLLACASILLSASAFATPTEEITSAVAVNGATDVSQARPRQFVKAFTAVALRVPPRELPDYVIAAINLRPDLAPSVVGIAIKSAVKNWETKPVALCAMIERIVRAGIAANPDAAVSITKAATAASPELRKCVVEAAVAAVPDAKDAIVHAATATTVPFAFLTFSATDTSGFSFMAATLSPANISNLGDDGRVNSPEQPPSH
jgi:hypothetical protein